MKKNKKYYWNNFYKKRKSQFFWPWSDLVSLVNQFFKKKERVKVLEIGVGNGANIPFFLEKNFDFYGIDSSEFIIKILKKRFPKLKNKLYSGNFEDINVNKSKFDLIVDRGAISCGNDKNQIFKIVKLIHLQLKKGGIFIGVDWYSKSSSYYKQKIKKSRSKNFFTFRNGPFKNIGSIYFSNKKNILNFFQNFNILKIEEKKVLDQTNLKSKIFSTWSFVVKK